MDLTSLFSLSGRTALVTGGSRGIGRMIVEGFLAAGCDRVFITARKMDQVRATVDELGDKVVGMQSDLSTVDGVRSFAEELKGHTDRLDILVNNAGAAWGAPFEEFPESGLGPGDGPEREITLLPHPGTARDAEGGGDQRSVRPRSSTSARSTASG